MWTWHGITTTVPGDPGHKKTGEIKICEKVLPMARCKEKSEFSFFFFPLYADHGCGGDR